MKPRNEVLSDEDTKKLILAALEGAGERRVTKERLVEFIKWAEGALTDAALVKLVLDGRLSIDIRAPKPGDWKFAPTEREGAVR